MQTLSLHTEMGSHQATVRHSPHVDIKAQTGASLTSQADLYIFPFDMRLETLNSREGWRGVYEGMSESERLASRDAQMRASDCVWRHGDARVPPPPPG